MNKDKAKWLNARSKSMGGYLTMERVNSNKSIDVYYRKSMQNLFRAFITARIKELKKHYKSIKTSNNDIKSVSKVGSTFNKISGEQLDLFMGKAEKLIIKYVGKLSRTSLNDVSYKLQRFYGMNKKFTIQYNKARYNELLKLFIKRNMATVEGLCERTINKIENITYNAMSTGSGWSDIENNLMKYTAMGEKHIKEIARDQTAKATEEINMFMQISAGAKYFEWSTSKDERVSTGFGGHDKLDGKIYKYDDEYKRLPIIDSYGNRGYPAQRVNCRCTALAVFIDEGFSAIWDKSSESYKIIKSHW